MLSQFLNIESEAEKFAEEWLQTAGPHFDPDRHDPSQFYEKANDESVQFYQLLDNMRNRTRLSIVAGFFHEWDKQVRDWMTREMHHWHRGDEVKKALWTADFRCIADLLESFGWKIKSQSYYTSLDRCRLVVNVYKHGDGPSFQEIKNQHPEFIRRFTEEIPLPDCANHSDLMIEDKHITEFSHAIIQFWEGIPECIVDHDDLNAPKWFEKALQKDRDQATKSKGARA